MNNEQFNALVRVIPPNYDVEIVFRSEDYIQAVEKLKDHPIYNFWQDPDELIQCNLLNQTAPIILTADLKPIKETRRENLTNRLKFMVKTLAKWKKYAKEWNTSIIMVTYGYYNPEDPLHELLVYGGSGMSSFSANFQEVLLIYENRIVNANSTNYIAQIFEWEKYIASFPKK